MTRSIWIIIATLSNCCTLAQTRIDTARTFHIGGIQQYVALKGNDDTKPLLLFLHGGPGNSVISYAEKFTTRLQDHFVVVHWDQRQTGKTLSLNKSTELLTAKQFVSDTRQLIDTLLAVYQRPKIYLAAHSWGTFLGFQIAKNFPAKVYALFAIGPMINQFESETLSLNIIQQSAIKTGNKTAINELARVKIPFENGDQLFYHRKWLLKHMGSSAKITMTSVQNWATTWLKIFNEASAVNLFEMAPVIDCPVYFFVGRNDLQTNSNIADKYYQSLTAPKKGLFWFERSAHSLPTTEPDKLQQLIIQLKEE